MIRPKDRNRYNALVKSISDFSSSTHPLPGVADRQACETFAAQLLESVHRVEYVCLLRERSISTERLSPASALFDPLKAAALYNSRGNLDEACWLVFLSTHFGKAGKSGWLRVQDVYGALGDGPVWEWRRISENPRQFRDWLRKNSTRVRGRFGNHRKYQSLSADKSSGTGAAVESYAGWIYAYGSHHALFLHAEESGAAVGQDPFNVLYTEMNSVKSFGRTAKFDYLTMLGKLGLANITPLKPYLSGSTGPITGARLMFGPGSLVSRENLVITLGCHLDVGMQEMEDALCNWQKSPRKFIAFRG